MKPNRRGFFAAVLGMGAAQALPAQASMSTAEELFALQCINGVMIQVDYSKIRSALIEVRAALDSACETASKSERKANGGSFLKTSKVGCPITHFS